MPKCRHSRTFVVGVALGETVSIECQVLANPSEVIFEWALNGTLSPKVPLSHKSSGLISVAKFVITNQHDFGHLYCWARNSIGRQQKPCVFELIKAGMNLRLN